MNKQEESGVSMRLRVKEYMIHRGMRPSQALLVRMGISRYIAHRVFYDDMKSIAFSDLARLCEVLRCTPRELIEVDAAPGVLHEAHPLHDWIGRPLPQPEQVLKALRPDELAEADMLLRELLARRRGKESGEEREDTGPEKEGE